MLRDANAKNEELKLEEAEKLEEARLELLKKPKNWKIILTRRRQRT